MNTYWLKFTLESDATFGKGAGIPGLVDQEVTLDRLGCPYLHGRTLKGLLNEVCADILYVLPPTTSNWKGVADALFGQPGSVSDMQGSLRVGHAQLPNGLRNVIANELAKTQAGQWTVDDIVDALTTIRQQTAMKEDGSPDPHTLRSVRVILRQTPFASRLEFRAPLSPQQKGLLAACVKGFRRAGIARNRGRGRLKAWLEDANGRDVTETWYSDFFKKEVCP